MREQRRAGKTMLPGLLVTLTREEAARLIESGDAVPAAGEYVETR